MSNLEFFKPKNIILISAGAILLIALFFAAKQANLFSAIILFFAGTAVGVLLARLLKNSAETPKQSEKQKSRPTPVVAEPIKSSVYFSDIAGLEFVKDELRDIVEFFKNPKKFSSLGVRAPRGVLLSGPPGVGKTLIAKALANECGMPFFYKSAATFVHLYVGAGANSVSELFSTAKANAPAVIFIDEVDAIGRHRGSDAGAEREATLNQILIEMDGFEEGGDVLVIAATNKPEMLDSALLRAGRFDRRVFIELPNAHERTLIVQKLLLHKSHSLDISELIRLTTGYSAATIDSLINEAALEAVKCGVKAIAPEHLCAVIDKVANGKKEFGSFSLEEKKALSIYHAAQAVVAARLKEKFSSVTLYERLVTEQPKLVSAANIKNLAMIFLSGSVATEMVLGQQFTFAADDISEAKELIKELSSISLAPRFHEADFLLQLCSEAKELLVSQKEQLQNIASLLLERERISYEEIF